MGGIRPGRQADDNGREKPKSKGRIQERPEFSPVGARRPVGRELLAGGLAKNFFVHDAALFLNAQHACLPYVLRPPSRRPNLLIDNAARILKGLHGLLELALALSRCPAPPSRLVAALGLELKIEIPKQGLTQRQALVIGEKLLRLEEE